MKYESHNVKNWEGLKSVVNKLLANGEIIWRGQSNASYKLNSSLFRHFSQFKIPSKDWLEYEINALENLKYTLESNPLIPNFPKNPTKIDLMNVLQHYRCPTRLLDWSW